MSVSVQLHDVFSGHVDLEMIRRRQDVAAAHSHRIDDAAHFSVHILDRAAHGAFGIDVPVKHELRSKRALQGLGRVSGGVRLDGVQDFDAGFNHIRDQFEDRSVGVQEDLGIRRFTFDQFVEFAPRRCNDLLERAR